MSSSRLLVLGVALIFVGFLVLVVGSFVGPGSSSSSSGGFILIGPFPIVFGTGPNSGMLAAVGLGITAAMVAVYLVMLIVWRSGKHREAKV